MTKINLLTSAALAAITTLADSPAPHIRATATVTDGSTIKAEFLSEGISGSTLFATRLTLRPDLVRTITFKGSDGTAQITLRNEDSFSMKLTDCSYRFNSVLGTLDIGRENLRAIRLTPSTHRPDGTSGLIFHCTFDDAEAVSCPAIGPRAIFNKARFMDGKFDQAMSVRRYSPEAAFDLPPHFFGKAGCIEFWAKILKQNPSVGWGGDPRLFSVRDTATGDPFFMIDIVSNDGRGDSGFATWSLPGNFASISGMRGLTYQELFDKDSWRDWHHYAIVWDDSGIKGIPEKGRRAALFIDGKLTPCAKFDNRNTAELERLIASSSRLSFTYDPDQDHELQTKSPFLIDEFRIWNYAKFDFDL